MTQFVIGIGSNIDPEANLRQAAALLREQWPEIQFSAVYRSSPIGPQDQADFLNAVGVFQTEDAPERIYERLSMIESTLKKDPPFRGGPRTIDLDLLLADDTVQKDPMLTIPHPRMHTRRFVLEPLLELIVPETSHPALGLTWNELHGLTRDQEVEKTEITL